MDIDRAYVMRTQ